MRISGLTRYAWYYPTKYVVWTVDTSDTSEKRFSEWLKTNKGVDRVHAILSLYIKGLGGGLSKLALVDIEGNELDNMASYVTEGGVFEMLAKDIVVAGSGNTGTATLIVFGVW